MTARYFATLIALFLALSSCRASARDPSIGLGTRKDEFVAKLDLIDPLVQKLTAAKEHGERDGLAAELAETYDGGSAIECLIRYREPEMARVFLKLLDHERWPIRARALYGLKMVGAQNYVAEVARLLDDSEPQVREQAASTLGHLGGKAAVAALKKRDPDEENAYVRATIAASLKLASSIEGYQIVGMLKGTNLSAGDAAKTSTTIQIVSVDRGVLYPGKSKIVIQRTVVRAALTDSLYGIPFQPKDGRMTIPFSRSLAAITQANIDFLMKSEAAGAWTAQTFAAKMDPRQLTVVAYVRDGSSKKILQAVQVNPRQPQATGIDTSE